MIVDVHTHIWNSSEQLGPDATERIRRGICEPWERPDASPEAHRQAMEPVDYCIVHGFVSKRLGANIGIDQVAKTVEQGGGKVLGFAGIDPMVPGYLDELNQAADVGLVGVTISPAAQGYHPSHTRAEALYERCAAMGFPVMVHPGSQFSADSLLPFAQPHLFDEVARQFPNLRLVIAQVGHPWIDPTLTLIGKHANIWADVSDLVLRPWSLYNALLAAQQQGVIDRLLIGSDFPFCTPQNAIMNVYSINTFTQGTHLPGVPREQLRAVVERDALTCLGLTPGRQIAAVDPGPTALTADREEVSAIEQPPASPAPPTMGE